uniref:Retrotransposon gag domain-containing protein n=1 Tax=Oryza brachyantha TaxID=4533 RepID=J3LAX5_ORYBR
MAPPRANTGRDDGSEALVGDRSKLSPSGLPVREIPGGYGVPFLSPLRDRLDYYYFQGAEEFFRSRVARHGGATVLRVNMPPGPFLAGDSRVVALLDARSFRVLLDDSSVDKADTLDGTFMPSLALFGGHRPLAFLDAGEPRHAEIKRVVMGLAAARMHHVPPAFRAAFAAMFDAVDASLDASSGTVEFNKLNMKYMLDFTCVALFGGTPPSKAMGNGAVTKAVKWLIFQLHPLASKIVKPWMLEDILLHTFRLPPFLVRGEYAELTAYFADAAAAVLDDAAKNQPGIPRDELLHNLVFVAIFNAYGGFKIFLPHLVNSSESGDKVCRFEPDKEAPDQTQIQSRSHDTEMSSPKSTDLKVEREAILMEVEVNPKSVPAALVNASNTSSSMGSFVPPREIFVIAHPPSDDTEKRTQEEEVARLSEERQLQDEREHQKQEEINRRRAMGLPTQNTRVTSQKGNAASTTLSADWINKAKTLKPRRSVSTSKIASTSTERSNANVKPIESTGIKKYDGSTDPKAKLTVYTMAIRAAGGDTKTIANYLPVALDDSATHWLSGLPKWSIDSWAELRDRFIANLQDIKDDVVIAAFRKGVKDEPFIVEFTRKEPTTAKDLFDMANSYAASAAASHPNWHADSDNMNQENQMYCS